MAVGRRWLAAALLGLPALACAAGLALAVLWRPPHFASHREVVAYMLRQRGLTAAELELSQPWPESVNYYAYGASVYPFTMNLEGRLSDSRRIAGRVECRRDRYDCQLTIAALGLDREPMPDVSDGRRAWPEWLERAAARVGVRL